MKIDFDEIHEWNGERYSFKELLKVTGMTKIGLYRALEIRSKKKVRSRKGPRSGHKKATLYTWKGITKSVFQWTKEKNLLAETLESRIRRGVPEEVIFDPVVKIDDDSPVSSDFEAWGNLTPSQLETMREFDQIGRIARY